MSDLEPTVNQDARITLREITAENVNALLTLSAKEHQKQLVASHAISIAQPHFRPEAWFRAIYADDTPVRMTRTWVLPHASFSTSEGANPVRRAEERKGCMMLTCRKWREAS